MKKIFIGLLFGILAGVTMAATTIEEAGVFLKADVVNATSPWFKTNGDDVGVGIIVTSGSCKVEIALDKQASCDDNTATAFDWNASPTITAPNKAYVAFTGISCVRATCTTGAGKLLVRRR